MNGLVIAIPMIDGKIHARCILPVAEARTQLMLKGIPCEIITCEGESLISRARNVLVRHFLTTPYDHMVFVDSDIVSHPSDIARLWATGLDAVGAVYPKKKIRWDYVASAIRSGKEKPQNYAAEFVLNISGESVNVGPEGVAEVDAVGTGFFLTSRKMLLQMCDAYPETLCVSDSPGDYGTEYFALYDTAIRRQRYLSEDYEFCRRYRAIGGKVHAHLGITLGHIGHHTYAGDLNSMFETP